MKMKQLTCSLALLAISSLFARADLVHQWTFANTNNLNDVFTGTTNRLIYRLGGAITNAVFTNDTPFGVSNALSGYSLNLLQQSNNCYVLGSNTNNFTPTNMTFAAWVKINGWTATDDQWEAIFAQLGTGAGFRLSRISTFAYSGVDFVGAGALYARDGVSQVNIADNTWHHVAFTYDSLSSNLTYFVDGVQKNQGVTPYYPTTNVFLSIGAYNTAGGRSMNGLIYDVRIYNTALPAWQVASLTNTPSTVLFSDTFNDANSTNWFAPTNRATGTLATNVFYAWLATNNVAVTNGVLTWSADGTANAFNELATSAGIRNLRFGTASNSGYFDWYPYVGGKVWEVQYDTLTGNSQPLTFGLSHITRNGSWTAWSDTNFDFSFGNYGVACRFDGPNGAQTNYTVINNVFPTRTNTYNIRLRFDEPKGLVTMYVNGTNIATTNLYNIGLANHRYISWGEPNKFGGNIDNLTISLPNTIINVQAFPTIAAASNLIANGNFTQVSNMVAGMSATTFNVNGSRGDYYGTYGSTADVPNWAPYYSDPYGLTTNCVPFVNDPGYVLNGTFYLDTHITPSVHQITLNSAYFFLNGLIQTNILNGATIQPGAQYQFQINAATTATTEQFYAAFAAALTVGSGANATNPATAIPNSAFSLWAKLLPTSGTTNITSTISGADLLTAQGSGPVNVIFNQINSNGIAGYPTTPDPNDLSQVSQVKVYSVSLAVVVPTNDLNHDGVVNQNDVTLAQSYLSGSIDGGASATNRQNTLINNYAFTTNQALVYLNLTSFDINGDGYFDTNDVTALQALVTPSQPVLNYAVVAPGQIQLSWSGAYKLQWLTNTLSAGLQTNILNGWVDYPITNNPVVVTNDQTVPAAFFRLSN